MIPTLNPKLIWKIQGRETDLVPRLKCFTDIGIFLLG